MTSGLGGRRRAGALVGALVVALLVPVARSEAAPAPAEAPGVPEVAFLGDSIGRDAKGYITRTVDDTHAIAYYRAVAAGFIGWHLDSTEFLDVIDAEGGPDIVLAELGTGDAFWDHSSTLFRSEVERFLDTVLPHVTCIAWFNQKPTPTRAYPYVNKHQVAFNAILQDVLLRPEYVDKVHLVDYAAWYRMAGDRFFLADLLHHTAAGRRELGLLARQAADGCDPATASGPFWDVPNDHWAFDAISWLGDEGIATGYPNGTYRANLGSFKPTVTRVQMATMMWKVVGSPAATQANPWTDSPAWADPALDWLKEHGIVRGVTATQFRPDQTLTRIEAAQWLWRLAGSPTSTAVPTWTDIAGLPAADSLPWIFETGLISGFPDGGFHPNDPVTRAQVASFLYGFHQLPPPPPPEETAPEATPTTAPPTTTTVPPTTVPPTTSPPTTF